MGSSTNNRLFLVYLLPIFVLVGSTEFQHTIYGKRGEISSPNYPRHYPLNATVNWLISVEPSNTIQVNFTNFNLEKNKKCIYDYVYMEERLAGGGSITRKYCGHKLPPSFTSVSNKIKVVFVSDALSNVEIGFKAKWREVSGSTLDHVRLPLKPTASSCLPNTVTLSKPCTPIRPSPSVVTSSIKPSKCSCSKITETVTKTKKVFIAIVKATPTLHVSSVAVTQSVTTKSKKTPQPTEEISNKIDQVDKCGDPSSHSLMDEKQVEEKDRSRNLVVSLGVVLIALFITNIFLLVLLCKRERGYSAISFNSLRKYLSGRNRSMQNTPDMFFSSYTRPTLRMINGEIVVVPPPDPSSPDNEHMRVLLEPYEPNRQSTNPALEDQIKELPFHLVPQQQDTLNYGTDENTIASTQTDVISDNENEAL